MNYTAEELAAYVRQLRGQYDDAAIRQSLRGEGCSDAQIEAAFAAAAEPEPAGEDLGPDIRRLAATVLLGLAAVGAILGAALWGWTALTAKLGYGDLAAQAPRSQASGAHGAADEPARRRSPAPARPDLEPISALRQIAEMHMRQEEKYAELRGKLNEGKTKLNLGDMKSALAFYYGDAEGRYPKDLSELAGRYIDSVRELAVPPHAPNRAVEHYGAEVCSGDEFAAIKTQALRDTGRWGYVSDPKAPCYGALFVDCTHPDSKGRLWANLWHAP